MTIVYGRRLAGVPADGDLLRKVSRSRHVDHVPHHSDGLRCRAAEFRAMASAEYRVTAKMRRSAAAGLNVGLPVKTPPHQAYLEWFKFSETLS